MKKQDLLFAVSKNLSRSEAISFNGGLDSDEKHYLLKVSGNPKERHIARRERYVVVRYPRKGESVSNGHAVYANREDLI